jgi:hypothetical protein
MVCIHAQTMEFPPEIIRLIREYSQPCFKHFREYNRILWLRAMSDWPDLKNALQERPDEILPYLLSYETAQLEWLQVVRNQNIIDGMCKLRDRNREWESFTQAIRSESEEFE